MRKRQNYNLFSKLKLTSITFLCFLFILLTLSIFNLSLYFFSKPKTTYIPTDNLEQKVFFWKSFLYSHPSYFEGWVELANLELKMGDKNDAQIAFTEASKINPNSKALTSLKLELDIEN